MRPARHDGSLHAVMAAMAAGLRTLSRLWRNEIGITLPHLGAANCGATTRRTCWRPPYPSPWSPATAARRPQRLHRHVGGHLGQHPQVTLGAIRIRPSAPTDIALAYIDCDLYSSTMPVLEFLLPRLKNGMIIAFDDYFCWSATQLSGERRAQLEFFSRHSRWELAPFVQFGWHGQSFVVEGRKILGA